MSVIVKQGDDVIIPIEIVDSPAVDFTAAEEIKVSLFVGEAEQKKYSLGEETDYGKLEVDSVDDNKINIFVTREESRDFAVGTVKAYVLAKFPNVAFPSGSERKSWEIVVARVVAGKVLDEEI